LEVVSKRLYSAYMGSVVDFVRPYGSDTIHPSDIFGPI